MQSSFLPFGRPVRGRGGGGVGGYVVVHVALDRPKSYFGWEREHQDIEEVDERSMQPYIKLSFCAR
jgi:hypothetical protein